MATVSDYTLHYLEMFDQLGLDRVNLVGFSMGGRIRGDVRDRASAGACASWC